MFRLFSTHYVWDLLINLALEKGAKMSEFQEICAHLQAFSDKPDVADSTPRKLTR